MISYQSRSIENININDRTNAEIRTGLGIDAETQVDNNNVDQQKKVVQTDLINGTTISKLNNITIWEVISEISINYIKFTFILV